MNLSTEKMGGMALLIGALLTVFTAVLHPKGGSIQYLQTIAHRIAISHSLGLLAIPFLGLGFWVLTQRMGKGSFISLLSFSFAIMGLLAGMIAASINGLALPLFIENYKDATEEITNIIKPIVRYTIALNKAFDYVFLATLTLAILFWSFSMLKLRLLSNWIGCVGIGLSLTIIVMFLTGYIFVNLHGFRLFLFLLVVWISLVGVALLLSKAEAHNNQ
jgi:hypothetical protein